METYITLSYLNDFIFCPRSIYFHQLYQHFEENVYKQAPQYKGTAAHSSIDNQSYSHSLHIMQGIGVYSNQYNIYGKIDVFNTQTGRLTERKREVKTIYEGYVFQVYAQCFGLRDVGYEVKEIVIHDLIHNKNYPIPLPEEDESMFQKFEQLILDINNFDFEAPFAANKEKCSNCIYNQLCDKSLC
jgi:CRISPR-associated protein Cas4